MRKTIFTLLITAGLFACNQSTDNIQQLNNRIDSLEKKFDNTYKSGLGEFMLNIQMHHAKLWFAGQAENWKLADFQIQEIIEALEDIQKYETKRTESQSIPMIKPALDSVTNAIQQKNPQLFKSSFVLLTNTCNNCHKATHHEFNVITIPTAPPFTNQTFKN